MTVMRFLAVVTLLASSTALAAPKDEVFAAWEAMFAAKSYRARIETTVNDQVFQQVVDVVLPGRMRMSGGPAGDMVVTPEGAWMKPPGEGWTQAPAATSALGKQFLSRDFIEQAKAGVQSVEDLGTEDLDGKRVRIYQLEQTMTIVGVESSSSTRLYVDVASGRPVRQEIESRAMGRSSRTVQTLEYLADLKIDAPE